MTGGAGFIGAHLIGRLLKDGCDVVCLDTFDHSYDPALKRKNIEPFLACEDFTLIEGDINDSRLLGEAVAGCEYVIHEAAQAGVRKSVGDPITSHRVNVTGTLAVLQASVDAGVKKVINASSSSVYGTVHYLPFDEEHPTTPISPYGVTKLAAEHYCRVFTALYGLETVSLRYFSVFGPRMRPDLAISIFTRKAFAGEPIEIFGDGTKTRDFTYIDDIVEANMCAMRRGCGLYNIGSGHRMTITSLAEAIIAATGSTSRIEYAPAVKGDAEHTCADTTKAQRELGWCPQVHLDRGLLRYIAWVLNSRW